MHFSPWPGRNLFVVVFFFLRWKGGMKRDTISDRILGDCSTYGFGWRTGPLLRVFWDGSRIVITWGALGGIIWDVPSGLNG